MKYFLSTKFLENTCTLDPVSIAIVSEDDREFYGEYLEYDQAKASLVEVEFIISKLTWAKGPDRHFTNPWKEKDDRGDIRVVGSRENIAIGIREFLGDDPCPEFWGYECAYDWLVLCSTFGGRNRVPEDWPSLCLDLKQKAITIGNLAIDETQRTDEFFTALIEAKWCQMFHIYLMAKM